MSGCLAPWSCWQGLSSSLIWSLHCLSLRGLTAARHKPAAHVFFDKVSWELSLPQVHQELNIRAASRSAEFVGTLPLQNSLGADEQVEAQVHYAVTCYLFKEKKWSSNSFLEQYVMYTDCSNLMLWCYKSKKNWNDLTNGATYWFCNAPVLCTGSNCVHSTSGSAPRSQPKVLETLLPAYPINIVGSI